ncbi:MAG: hypothetical protein L3J41_13915 [Melioribacteraceae bacterium]|nr:hypothetical protein [Melioribacteraceae bacterium]
MSISNYKITLYQIFLFGFFLLTVDGCSNKKNDFEKNIIAYVGDHEISVEDFRLNYEFGFAHLKAKGNKKLSYLEYMIDEALLSQEGYRLELNLSEDIKNKEKALLTELLVEELFKKEVDDKINISDDEIKEAISKSNVKWKLRYWVEPDLKDAKRVYSSIRKSSYEDVIQGLLSSQEVKSNIKDYETDYLTWLDMPPLLLAKIKDLEINKISKPILVDNVYILVEIIEIASNILSDYDYQATSDKYKQILFYREQKKKTALFLKSFMIPKEVITKGTGFGYILNALIAWKNSEIEKITFEEAIENANNSEPELLLLKKHYYEILVTFKDGTWSIKDFLTRFNSSEITAKASEKRKMYNQLNHQIAMSIRNHFFVEEALVHGLDKSPDIKSELKMWRDKWVYDELRRELTNNIKIDEATALEYFNTHKNIYKTKNGLEATFDEFGSQAKYDAYFSQTFKILENKLKYLKKEFPVRINRELLDSVKVFDTEKSRWSTVFLVKGNSNRIAIPTVDPSWGLKNVKK